MKTKANQTLQATADKRPGWQVECQRPAVPELIVGRAGRAQVRRHGQASECLEKIAMQAQKTEIPELALPFAGQPDSFASTFGERHA
jgi:hypothetical protein